MFVDYRNAAIGKDRQYVLYGHSMKNNTMFGTLSEYRRQSYYDAHSTLWLLTPEGSYKLEPLSGFITRADSDSYTLFETQEELTAYLEDAMGQSGFAAEVEPETVQRIVTLSTCTYQGDDKRFILVCALTELDNGQ